MKNLVLYSPNESACLDGRGFWGKHGWGELSEARIFLQEDPELVSLSTGNDAVFVSFKEAMKHYG